MQNICKINFNQVAWRGALATSRGMQLGVSNGHSY